MSRYLVKLTPYEKFFFGGENTFGENNVIYFVKSNFYPQQTTLLGLIRYQLLYQADDSVFSNNKIVDKRKAKEVIGGKSFDMGNISFSFGKIMNISTVFISNGDDFWFAGNREYQFVDDKFEFRKYEKKNDKCMSFLQCEKSFIPSLKDYKPKLGLPDLLINSKNEKKKYEDVFIESRQVGIRKNYEGKSGDKEYFVQISYRLKDNYSFAFILELDDSVKLNSNTLIFMGADQSKFKMEISGFNQEFINLLPKYEKTEGTDKLILVSDAYLPDNSILSVSDFAITDIIDFKSLKAEVDKTENYSDMKKENGKTVEKSNKFNLFKRGSVFYGNIQEIEKILKQNETLSKLGFNKFKSKKHNEN